MLAVGAKTIFQQSISPEELSTARSELDRIINKRIFGVFVTIRRSKKLPSWPEDIHGCLGYWDEGSQYRSLTAEVLLQQLIRLSYNTAYQDPRNRYFPPLETDPDAILEFSFLRLPVWSVNSSGFISELNRPFDNDEFGLIVEDTVRATYLPKVFGNESWEYIQVSLLQKAGMGPIRPKTEPKFLAYRTYDVQGQFKNLLD